MVMKSVPKSRGARCKVVATSIATMLIVGACANGEQATPTSTQVDDSSGAVSAPASSATDAASSPSPSPTSATTASTPPSTRVLLSEQERDFCLDLASADSDLRDGSDGVGLADMSSGGGGFVLTALDMRLSRLRLSAAELRFEGTSLDTEALKHFVDVAAYSGPDVRGGDSWQPRQAMAVGQAYAHARLACVLGGEEEAPGRDWSRAMEWVSGVEDLDNELPIENFCEGMRRSPDLAAFDEAFAGLEAPVAGGWFAFAALYECPEMAEVALAAVERAGYEAP